MDMLGIFHGDQTSRCVDPHQNESGVGTVKLV